MKKEEDEYPEPIANPVHPPVVEDTEITEDVDSR